MSEFSDSYILRVLLAPHTPTRAVDTVARRWRWLPRRGQAHNSARRSGAECAGRAAEAFPAAAVARRRGAR